MPTQVIYNSKNNEWYTPVRILELVRLFLGDIELDVASCEISNQNVKAKKFFDINNDALVQSWSAPTVWMNPPYSKDLFSKFVEKFIHEFENKSFQKGCVITNNNTETRAGQLLLSSCSFALFISKRVKFLNQDLKPTNTPLQGQTLYFFGATQKEFLEIQDELDRHGQTLVNYKKLLNI